MLFIQHQQPFIFCWGPLLFLDIGIDLQHTPNEGVHETTMINMTTHEIHEIHDNPDNHHVLAVAVGGLAELWSISTRVRSCYLAANEACMSHRTGTCKTAAWLKSLITACQLGWITVSSGKV